MRNLKTNDISDIMTDLHRSRLVCLGSATLNNQYLPTMGKFLGAAMAIALVMSFLFGLPLVWYGEHLGRVVVLLLTCGLTKGKVSAGWVRLLGWNLLLVPGLVMLLWRLP